jgi:hypothetical protein
MQPKLPDLVVESLVIRPNKMRFAAGEFVVLNVVVKNQGLGTSVPTWVDLYINPSIPPSAANTRWSDVCKLRPCFGLAWAIPALAPGEEITLTSEVGNYAVGYSIWHGWFAAGTTDLYVYVDSWDDSSIQGAAVESDETNNVLHLGGLSVQGDNPPRAQQYRSAQMPEHRPRPEDIQHERGTIGPMSSRNLR